MAGNHPRENQDPDNREGEKDLVKTTSRAIW
jgi:hypothetical protein